MHLSKKIGLVLVVAFIAIQFFPPAHNDSGQVLATDISKNLSIPLPVSMLLKTACYDCHSNQTTYPWYTYVQPIGWLLNDHIQKGKAELNFSEFASYSIRRQQSKLKSIASQINDGEMPLESYTWIHKNARLSKQDKKMISDWALKSIDTISKRNEAH